METKNNKPKVVTVRPYTNEQIDAHAGSVGGKRNLREIKITTDDDYEFYYLVKKPSRNVLQAVALYEKKKDTDGIQKIMLGCVLEGDRDAYEHDGAIYSQLLHSIGKLANTARQELKKL